MPTSLVPLQQLKHPPGTQTRPPTLQDQLNALLEADLDVGLVAEISLIPHSATARVAEALCSTLTEFERTAERQRELFLQSLAQQTEPLHLTRSRTVARELAEKGKCVARFQQTTGKISPSGGKGRNRWFRMFSQGIFQLDEHTLFDRSVYTFANDLALKLSSGPIAEVFAPGGRILFRWEPVNREWALPAGRNEFGPRGWGSEGSAEQAALGVICFVAPILRNWEEGLKRLSIMALDSSAAFRRTVVSDCLRAHEISVKKFDRFRREEKLRRRQIEMEREAAAILAM